MEVTIFDTKGKRVCFSKQAQMYESETAFQKIVNDYRKRCDNMLMANLMRMECEDARVMSRKEPNSFGELKKYMEDNNHKLVVLPGWIKNPVFQGVNKDDPNLCDYEGGIDLSRLGIVEGDVVTLFNHDILPKDKLKEYAISVNA